MSFVLRYLFISQINSTVPISEAKTGVVEMLIIVLCIVLVKQQAASALQKKLVLLEKGLNLFFFFCF